MDSANLNPSTVIDEYSKPSRGVWIAVFLLGICVLLNLYPTQPILGHIAEWADVSTTSAAWTISATTLGVALSAPVAGAISDHIGRKRVIVAALAVMLIASLACATAPPFEAILVLRVMQGIGVPFVSAVAVAYMAEEFAPTYAVRLNATYLAGAAFGGFSGRFAAGTLISFTDRWSLVFLPIAAILVVTLFAAIRWLPEECQFVATPSIRSGIVGLVSVIREPRLLGTCFVGAALLFLQVTSFTYGSLHVQDPPFQLTSFEVSLIFLVFLIPMFTTPVVGMIMSRVGEIRTYWLSSTVGIVGLVLTATDTTVWFITGLAAWCVAVFAGQASATRFTARWFTANRSAAVGWYLTAFYLGGTIGGVAPAPLYESRGWIACVILMVVIAIASAIVATVSWKDPATP